MTNLSYLYKIKASIYLCFIATLITLALSINSFSFSGLLAGEVSGNLAVIIGGIAAIILAMASVWVHKFSKDLTKVREKLELIAKGDFETRLTNISDSGEVAQLYWSINRVVDKTDAYIRESSAAMASVAQNKFYRKIMFNGFAGSFLTGSQVINSAMQSIDDRLGGFTSLTQSFENNVETVISELGVASEDLDKTANEMGIVAQNTRSNAEEVSKASSTTSHNVQTVSSATVELSSSISEISTQISLSGNQIGEAIDKIAITETNMNDLKISVNKIGDVVALITDIAAQTNLLALNATIEASRAGEAGRGFAVVASEVKALASQTSTATNEIGTLVASIQTATNTSIDSFKSVGASVNSVSDITNVIVDAVGQQSIATDEISKSIIEVSDGSTEVTNKVITVSKDAESSEASASGLIDSASGISKQSMFLSDQVDEFLKQVRHQF